MSNLTPADEPAQPSERQEAAGRLPAAGRALPPTPYELLAEVKRTNSAIFADMDTFQSWNLRAQELGRALKSRDFAAAEKLVESGEFPRAYLASEAVLPVLRGLQEDPALPAALRLNAVDQELLRRQLIEFIRDEITADHGGRLHRLNPDSLLPSAEVNHYRMDRLEVLWGKAQFADVFTYLQRHSGLAEDPRFVVLREKLIGDEMLYNAFRRGICAHLGGIHFIQDTASPLRQVEGFFALDADRMRTIGWETRLARLAQQDFRHLPDCLARSNFTAAEKDHPEVSEALRASLKKYLDWQGANFEQFRKILTDLALEDPAGLLLNTARELAAERNWHALGAAKRFFPAEVAQALSEGDVPSALGDAVLDIAKVYGQQRRATSMIESLGAGELLRGCASYQEKLGALVTDEIATLQSNSGTRVSFFSAKENLSLTEETFAPAVRTGIAALAAELPNWVLSDSYFLSRLTSCLTHPAVSPVLQDPSVQEPLFRALFCQRTPDQEAAAASRTAAAAGWRYTLPPSRRTVHDSGFFSVQDLPNVVSLITGAGFSEDLLGLEPFQDRLRRQLSNAHFRGSVEETVEILDGLSIPAAALRHPEMERLQSDSLARAVLQSGGQDVTETLSGWKKFAPQPEVVSATYIRVFAKLCFDSAEQADTFADRHRLSPEDRRRGAAIAFVASAKRDAVVGAVYPRPDLLRRIGEPIDPALFPPAFRSAIELLELTAGEQLQEFVIKSPLAQALGSMAADPAYGGADQDVKLDEPLALSPAAAAAARGIPVSDFEAEILLRCGIPIEQYAREGAFDKIAESLFNEVSEWRREQHVRSSFTTGAEIFGYPAMLRYVAVHRPHDALNDFAGVIEVWRHSGEDAATFARQILGQVTMDTGDVAGQTAAQRLTAISRTLAGELKTQTLAEFAGGVSDAVAHFKNLENLQARARSFADNPATIFASWGNLRSFAAILEALKNVEFLDELEALRASEEPGAKARADWYYTLAFDPESKIEFSAVLEMMRDPRKFLDRDEDPTIQAFHEPKKPSHYAKVPHLDLMEAELIAALQLGTIDSLQSVPPFSMRFLVPAHGTALGSVREAARYAVNTEPSRRTERFRMVQRFLAERGVSAADWFAEKVDLPATVEDELIRLVYSREMGLKEPLVSVNVSVAAKSDARAQLAGNKTKSCMAFGQGKQIVYAFHLGCAQLLVEVDRFDSVFTLAQSVVTEDRDVFCDVSQVFEKAELAAVRRNLTDTELRLSDLLPEQVLREDRFLMSGDNREISKNKLEKGSYLAILNAVYGAFLNEYLKRLPEEWRGDRRRVPVGMAYSYGMDAPTAPNTTAPVAPIGWSDKRGPEVYEILQRPRLAALMEVTREMGSLHPTYGARVEDGISPLTFRHAIPAAMLEEKAYASVPELQGRITQLQRVLMASAINNEAKGRPHLSFYLRDRGTFAAYIIAYEGRVRSEGGETTPVIYVQDFASQATSRGLVGAGQKELLRRLMRELDDCYWSQGKLYPIFAHLYERTTYRFLHRAMREISREFGIDLALEERPAERWNQGVTMYPVFLRPVRSDRADRPLLTG